MDSLISAAARALAGGDALGALNRVALRDDPAALALRGIAMAQLGELARARELLRRAARGFGAHEALAQARCVVAEAEVALAARELAGSARALVAAVATLDAHADHANALHARLIAARTSLLLGRLDDAATQLAQFDAAATATGRQPADLPPVLRAVAELAAAELALRRIRVAPARAALARAQDAAAQARVPALLAEVAEAHAALDRPAARRFGASAGGTAGAIDGVGDGSIGGAGVAGVPSVAGGAGGDGSDASGDDDFDDRDDRDDHDDHDDHDDRDDRDDRGERNDRAGGDASQAMRLDEVEALLASGALVVDACRRVIGAGTEWRSLARRPVLFSLARALAQAWPGDVARDALIASAFRTRDPDDTHRARLRVELGRLRALLVGVARIDATARGFILTPMCERDVAVTSMSDGEGSDAGVLSTTDDDSAGARPTSTNGRDNGDVGHASMHDSDRTGAGTVAVLLPPGDDARASLLALLADGAPWSTSALALALGDSQRTVQRALAALEAAGRVRAIGQARARRWLAPPLTGFTTILLLPSALPIA